METQNIYLDVQSISKSFGDQELLRDISFSVAAGQKVGLIAPNGSGKTTLLSLLVGDDVPDSGNVVYRNGIKVGYLPQAPVFKKGQTVLDACFNHNEKDELILKAKQILTRLRITDTDTPIEILSGGMQKRVALANVLLTDPDFLILDEPTNHLDLQMIEWLEGWLSSTAKALLMVTHDRYFLDNVCNRIIEINNHTIYTYQGNYRYYLEKRQERIDAARGEWQHVNNLYRRELEWIRRQPQARGHKAKYRENAFEELEKKAKQRLEERQVRLKSKNVYIGSKIFESQYVSKSWGENVILQDFYYQFARFEKMGIVGDNGIGKSTFIKLLLGEIKPDQGRFDIGETVKFGYFAQDGIKVSEDKRVIDVVRDIAEYIDLGGGKHLSASQLLQHFLFTPEQQYLYVNKLSGGEKRKLLLCTVLMQNPNFLILDEPTNDLDIKTLQVLEEYLADFPGCVMIVSHDRYFMDKVIDHLLVFHGQGKVQDFPGNYTQYREWCKANPTENKTKKEKSTVKERKANVNEDGKKMSFKEKYEFEIIEKRIESLEEEIQIMENKICGGDLSYEELTDLGNRLQEARQELDAKTDRWLELSEMRG